MIRVSGGQYKGKKLKRVPHPEVRPMPQRLKESLFNILSEKIKDCVFLDGFAGTGSVGIEALSRGARVAIFVEEFFPAVKVIRTNLEKCEAGDQGRVIHSEFNRAVIRLSKEEAEFDIIVLDPPYRLLEERNPLKVIWKRGVLKEKGMIVLRRSAKIKFKSKFFHKTRDMKLGDDCLSFYVL